MDETSISLLAAAGTGDRDSVDRLVQIYRPFVSAVLRAKGVTREPEFDDLHQEVVLELIKVLHRFDRRGPGSLRAWLRTTIQHAVSRNRNLARSGRWLDVSAVTEPEQSPDDAGLPLEAAEVVRCLWEVCRRELTDQQREVFESSAFAQLPAEVVAERCGVTRNVVWLTRSRVLKRMRELAGEFYGCDPLE
jgi:RNA polymerase sigma-70 factor (ECF subfamily)